MFQLDQERNFEYSYCFWNSISISTLTWKYLQMESEMPTTLQAIWTTHLNLKEKEKEKKKRL